MPAQPGYCFVDAHLDLAYHCQEHGRGIVDPGDKPCMVTLPLLLSAGVRLVCGTLFTPHTGTPAERRARIEAQYALYGQWFTQYAEVLWPVRSKADLLRLADAQRVHWCGVDVYPVGVVLLLEGCELIEDADDLALWHGRGLRIASLTWNGVNQYASGTFGVDSGLTEQGIALLTEFRRLGIVLDLSHLSDRAVADVFTHYDGPLCATHSNSRTVAQSPRNLLDGQAQEIAQRGGVVGLNLLASFVRTGWKDGDELPAVAEATDHLEYLRGLLGPQHIGLGSDLDGGLTPLNTPAGIDRIDHLSLLLGDLDSRGWGKEDIAAFSCRNWWAFFERVLPD
ncbi:MAG: dipeptidase [bacterium]|nr:dipeptidase [bacterium]